MQGEGWLAACRCAEAMPGFSILQPMHTEDVWTGAQVCSSNGVHQNAHAIELLTELDTQLQLFAPSGY